jgi:hypothetical protein
MPYEHPIFPPFPDGSYGNYNSETEGRGLGPVNVSGIEEWSAGKSPYYVIGQAVSFKGLVYALNYNWDGTTVGSPGSQVDANGVRVWTLQCDNYLVGGQQFEMGYRPTFGTGASAYYNLNFETTIIRYWNYWHNISSAHSTVFEQVKYKASGESGFGRTLLTLASTVEIPPVNNAFGPSNPYFQSINFNDANGIDNKMFFFLTSSCGHTNGSGPWSSPWGIFEYYGCFKKGTSMEDIGTLYYEAPYSYTLATTDWRLSPEYDETSYGPSLSVNWSYTDKNGRTTTVNATNNTMKMRFGAETFLGRTYTGAYRVYVKDGLLSEIRMELDTVTPDMRTM